MNEIPHPGFDKPEEYETFATTNDLEEAAKQFVGYDMDTDYLRDYEVGISAFIAGAKWQKQQMLKGAVEGEVIVPIYEGDDTWSSEIKIPGRYEIGDKVRIIVCKKED